MESYFILQVLQILYSGENQKHLLGRLIALVIYSLRHIFFTYSEDASGAWTRVKNQHDIKFHVNG